MSGELKENTDNFETNILVAYFSAIGTTKPLAEYAAEFLNADLYEIVPFCISHSSGIGSSDTNLHNLASDVEWLSGHRFLGGTSREEMVLEHTAFMVMSVSIL